MQALTWRDIPPESESQGPSRRPSWSNWRGKKSAFLGYQKRLWLQWEAKSAQTAFLVIFDVTSSMLYTIARQQLLRNKKA